MLKTIPYFEQQSKPLLRDMLAAIFSVAQGGSCSSSGSSIVHGLSLLYNRTFTAWVSPSPNQADWQPQRQPCYWVSAIGAATAPPPRSRQCGPMRSRAPRPAPKTSRPLHVLLAQIRKDEVAEEQQGPNAPADAGGNLHVLWP